LVVATGGRPALDCVPAGATLYLDAAALAPDGALALEALLDDARVWVLAGAEPGAVLPGALGARLSAVVLTVPPLAARTAELPALAAVVVEGLGRRLGIAPPRLAADALERLGAHAWPGDLAELEAALARAFLLAGGGVIEAAHLDLGVEPPAAVAEAAAAAPGGAALEYLLAELAHELRNPLVTIKTFADHLPALLEDAELRARFATLTSEAIERMDGLLENVLAFARLGAPRREAVEVGPIMARVLAELAHELRNPLVTIKTFADHLPALLEDAELRARFATLTSEAIERMDGLLENVLAFARLGAPRREAVEVGPIMARVLAELEP